MYCPQCGQEQISNNTRFCSRCGLLVAGLADWLSQGGVMPVIGTEGSAKKSSRKRKGVVRGGKLMFFSAVIFPIFIGLSIGMDHPAPLFVPFTLFLAGLAILLYTIIFGEETSSTTNQEPSTFRLPAMFRRSDLPSGSSTPISNIPNRPVRTAELAVPPSVTENTTRLLDPDER